MKQICIICGSPVFQENLCEDCFVKRHELFEVPLTIKLKHCSNCGSFYDSRWVKDSVENIIKSKIKPRGRIAKIYIDISRNHAVVICTGYITPSRKLKKESKKISLLMESRKCDNCIKLLSGYYQAVVQIRGPRKDKILKYMMSFAKPEEIIAEKSKDGYDIKFIDKKRAEQTAAILKGFEIKKSYKLVTEKKGKKLYRNFYAIR